MKCAIFEEHSSSCVVYSRFSGTLFPVSMIDGENTDNNYKIRHYTFEGEPATVLGPVIMEYKRKNGFQSFLNVCDFSI